jgi:hypothetical protein
VRQAKVRHHDAKGIQRIQQEVGCTKVPVQDTQGVQMQQARQRLLQNAQNLDQRQATLDGRGRV